MFSIVKFFRKKKKKINNKEVFFNIIQAADEIVAHNYRNQQGINNGLLDLIKIIMKPIQSEHIRNVYFENAHCAVGPLSYPSDWFGCHYIDEQRLFIDDIKNKHQSILLNLSSDIVLPTCWNPFSKIDSLGTIGSLERSSGEFKQDSNHIVVLIMPMRIAFVTNGNHSIAQGIVSGNGTLEPDKILDLSIFFNQINFDGKNWINAKTNKIIGKPRYLEFGYVWEIAKKLIS